MNKIWEKLETMSLAVAFAEAGDHENARLYLQSRVKGKMRNLKLEKRQEQQLSQPQQDLRL